VWVFFNRDEVNVSEGLPIKLASMHISDIIVFSDSWEEHLNNLKQGL